MSQISNDPEFQETVTTADASLGSPNETDNFSAADIPSEQDATVSDEGMDFFNDDYLSNLGKETGEDPAEDKDDLSELPGFADSPEEDETPEEKKEEDTDPAATEKPVDEAIPAEQVEKIDAEKAIDDDPNLTDEDKAAIKELPKSRWKEFQRAKTYARTEAKFLDPNEKMGDFIGHLEQKSPARLGELRSQILLDSVSKIDDSGARQIDGTKLLNNLFETTGAETYTQVVSSIIENYPAQAAEMLKSKGFTLVADGESAPISTAKPDADRINTILEQAQMYLEDEDVEYLRGAYQGTAAVKPTETDDTENVIPETKAAEDLPNADPNPDAAAKTEETTEKSEKTEAEPTQPNPEEIQRWDAAVNESLPVVDRHLQNLMEENYGLSISEIERTNIPELATVKEEKRFLLLHGSPGGELPPFDIGLIERFREDADFKKAFDSFVYFAQKGENANAQNAIRELIPFAETLLEERLDHEVIKRKDLIIKRISDSYNNDRQPNQEIHLEGSIGGGGNPGKTENTNSFLDPSTL